MLIIEIFLAILLLFAPITSNAPTTEIQEPPFINNTFTNTTTDPMPISNYIRPYNITKTTLIWKAINGTSYIDPEHEVVQWYARNTILNETGLYYLTGGHVLPDIFPDDNYENQDYWMNADYYLSHGLTGDCEDYAIAIASILEAKNIPNMFVAISCTMEKHHYLQYYYNGKYYTADFTCPRYMIREDNPRNTCKKEWMFNKTTPYTTYQENWSNTQ